MAVFLSTTYLHITSITSLSWVHLRIAFHSKNITLLLILSRDMAVFLSTTYLHIISFTNLTWAYLRIANYNLPSHCLHHKFTKRYGSVSLYHLPSHRLHHKFVLSLSSHCWLQLTFTLPSSQVYHEIWQCFSLQLTFTSPPSQICLELIFALLTTTYLRIAFITSLSRDMAVFLSTTYLHITSITSLFWVNLRIAFRSKHLHAAP